MKWIRILFIFFPILGCTGEVLPVAVIGSGPAGLSAALVTGRERVETHVFTGNPIGGPVNAVTCLSNWPGSVKGKGNVVMKRLFEQLERFQVKLHPQEIKRVDFSTRPFRLWADNGESFLANSVIIATGAIAKKLNVENETAYLGKGIETYVYKSDAARFEGKTVAVVGGGIDAMKKALIAAKTAKKVYVIIRGSSMQKPFMEKRLQKKETGIIEILYETKIAKVMGNSRELTGVVLMTPSGKRECLIDSLILAIGITPNTSLVKGKLQLDDQGYIVLKGRTQATSVPGVFSAGNATDKIYHQAAISAGEGMKAGYDALSFLGL